MEFTSTSMFNKSILDYYTSAAKNNFLPMVTNSFKSLSSGPDKLEVKDGYQNELTIKFIFNNLNDEILTNLQVSFSFVIHITNLGSAFREPGRRFLKGSCSILSSMRGGNGYTIMADWMYKKTGYTTTISLKGIEDKPEEIQLEKMLIDVEEFINKHKDHIHEHYNDLMLAHPELYEGFKSVRDIFLF